MVEELELIVDCHLAHRRLIRRRGGPTYTSEDVEVAAFGNGVGVRDGIGIGIGSFCTRCATKSRGEGGYARSSNLHGTHISIKINIS